jgi:DNA polymerase-4
MRVKDGKKICSELIILPADPWKYRNVHLALRDLISNYTPEFSPKSIDEFVLNMKDCPKTKQGLKNIAAEIKKRIKREIGEWITVSVGIAPNRLLAKLASNLKKPDGLVEINQSNFTNKYSSINLTDLPYIKFRNMIRLNSVGIFDVLDFYNSPLWKLKTAFKSINGYYWYLRLRGWEIDSVNFERKSFGNSYALPKPVIKHVDLFPILSKLITKMSFRLRMAGYKARGVHLMISYRNLVSWIRFRWNDTS